MTSATERSLPPGGTPVPRANGPSTSCSSTSERPDCHGRGDTVQVLERAHKDVMALSRTEKGTFYDFLHKFRQNPDAPGLRRKQLKGDSRLWSARITDDYRALLLHIEGDDFLVVAVKRRREVYDNLDRYEYRINRVTGGIEVIDLGVVGDSAVGRLAAPVPRRRKGGLAGLAARALRSVHRRAVARARCGRATVFGRLPGR